MSDRCKQHASALLDNHFADTGVDAEGPFDAELEALLDDEHARIAWQRYALVGHIMRGDASPHQHLDISASVAAQISQENVIVKPSVQSGGALSRAANRWLKPAGSIAIAASVAWIAVVSVQQPVGIDQQPMNESVTSPALITNPFGGRNPVSYNTVIEEQQAPSAAEVAQQRQLLYSYMLDHQRQLQLSLQADKEEQQQSERTTTDTAPDQND